MVGDEVTVDVEVEDPGPAGIPGARRPGSGRRRTRTTLRLSWRGADPLAVQLRLISTPDHPSLPRGYWVVLRDFLRYGLEEPTGDGQVRIGPEPGQDEVIFRLARNGRPAEVRAPSEAVRGFLDETEKIVPSGEESSEEALDALIRALLRA